MKDTYSNTTNSSNILVTDEDSRYTFDRSTNTKVNVNSISTTTEKNDELDALYDIDIDAI
jgi:hypothetical protein